MKKLITLLVFAALLQLAQAEYGGGVTTTQLSAQLATKLNASAVEPTVSSSTSNVPTSAAVSNALALKVSNSGGTATNLTLFGTNYIYNASETNAVYSYWDSAATQKVTKVIINAVTNTYFSLNN